MKISPDSHAPDQGLPDLASAEREQERRWLKAARRDSENFRFFYDKYLSRIRGYIFRRTRDMELTNDLAALTFTNALSNLDSFVWRDRLIGSWLFRIATNEIYKNAAGESKLHTLEDGDTAQNNTPDPRCSQLSRIILSEDQGQLHECLEMLDAQDQDILTLHYWEGLKTREVAEAMSISENTIKTRLARSRRKLKKLMAEHLQKPTS